MNFSQLIILLILSAGVTFASPRKSVKPEVRCSPKSLQQKNCLLNLGSGQYQFMRENLSLNDGTWRQVTVLPMTAENAEWESLRVFDLGGRRFFELKIWNEPDPLKIQSLFWFVVELNGVETKVRVEQIIQKRRPKENADPKSKTEYLADKVEKHDLKLKDKMIQWTVGYKKGEF